MFLPVPDLGLPQAEAEGLPQAEGLLQAKAEGLAQAEAEGLAQGPQAPPAWCASSKTPELVLGWMVWQRAVSARPLVCRRERVQAHGPALESTQSMVPEQVLDQSCRPHRHGCPTWSEAPHRVQQRLLQRSCSPPTPPARRTKTAHPRSAGQTSGSATTGSTDWRP